MNLFFLRSAWPSLTVETQIDWSDRVSATSLRAGEVNGRAWWFDTVLFSDRSAALRGSECDERTQRTAAEAVKGVVERAGGTGFLERGWWEPVRRSVLRFAGLSQHTLDIGTRALMRSERGSLRDGVEEVVVTYITRQGGVRRHLIEEDHEALVRALVELCDRRGWELIVAPMERLSREEQLAIAARTTVTHFPAAGSFLFLTARLVPCRCPWKWTGTSDHDVYNADFDGHRIVLSRRVRSRL